jgi:hypothetical protein
MDKLIPYSPLSDISGVPEYLISSKVTWIKRSEFELMKRSLDQWMVEKAGISDPRYDKIGRMLVSVDPETLRPNRVLHLKKGLKLFDLLFLANVSFYVPEEFGWCLRCTLLEKAEYLDVVDKAKLDFALSSRLHALIALSYKFRSRQSLLGYLNNRGLEAMSHLVTRPISDRRPKRTGRIRGYRDHGTLRPDHLWIERNPANTIHSQIHVIDHQIRTLFEIEWSKGYLVPQALLERLLEERRDLVNLLDPNPDEVLSEE